MRESCDHFVKAPYDMALSDPACLSMDPPSIVQQIHGFEDLTEDRAQLAMWSATNMYGGGADTTTSALTSFFLAMALYPRIQHEARRELDTYLHGSIRLPRMADRTHLPYINSIVFEVLRWGCVGPIAIPHRLSKEDKYRGWDMPVNSLVIPNIWGILHDVDDYPEPMEFKPERFMEGRVQVPS